MTARLLALLCLLCSTHCVKAQNAEIFGYDSRYLVPKSPNAASIEAVKQVAINHATGQPDVKINAYTLEVDQGLKIPFSFTYTGNGLKFGDMPNVLGYKWSLGGVYMISRTVNGMPDEDYFDDHQDSVPLMLDSMRNLTGEGTWSQYLMKQLINNRIDVNQDQFTVTLPNASFNLVRRNGKYYAESDAYKYKITRTVNEFIIKDEKGYMYYFGGGVNTNENSQPSHYSVPGTSDPEYNPGRYANAGRMLRKIVTPFGKEVNFEYIEYNLGYVASGITETFKKGTVLISGSTTACDCPNSLTTTHQGSSYQVALLKRVYTRNISIECWFSNRDSLQYWKRQMDSLVVSHVRTGKRLKKFKMRYGSFDTKYLKLIAVDEVNVYDSTKLKSHLFTYNEGAIPAVDSYSRDIYGYYNGASNSRLIPSTDAAYTQTYTTADRAPVLNYAKLTTLASITYPTGGSDVFTYQLNKSGSLYGPGVVVSQIDRFASANQFIGSSLYTYSQLYGGITFPITAMKTLQQLHNCQVVIITSDQLYRERLLKNYYYGSVVEKRTSGTDTVAIQFAYDAPVNGYGMYQPHLTNETHFLGTTSQKIKETIYTYNKETVDSLTLTNYVSLDPALTYKQAGNNFYCVTLYQGYQSFSAGPAGNLLLTKTVNTTYQGAAFYSMVDTFSFGSVYHRFATEVRSTTSDGGVKVARMKYPQDYGALSSPAIAYGDAYILDTMIRRNMINLVVEKESLAGAQSLLRSRISYTLAGDNLIHPLKEEILFADGTSKEAIVFAKFDQDRLMSYTDATGVNHGLIWNACSELPVAQSTNAGWDQMSYTSFELGDTLTQLSYQNNQIVNGAALSGRAYYTTSGTVTRNGLNSGLSYIVSVWTLGGVPTCNGSSSWQVGEVINGWTHRRMQVSGVSTITLTGSSGYLDELRIHPVTAQMQTASQEPAWGITAQGDANQQWMFYDYDGFNNLTIQRNKANQVVQYASSTLQDSSLTAGWALTGNTRCKTCPANSSYSAGVKQYEQINSSTSQTRWVDGSAAGCAASPAWQNTATALRCLKNSSNQNTGDTEQEQVDVNPCSSTYGKTQWVSAGTNTTLCPPPPPVCSGSNCIGLTKKCVNGVCEIGSSRMVSSVYKFISGSWKWECTTKWCFSDGSLSTHQVVSTSSTSCPTATCP